MTLAAELDRLIERFPLAQGRATKELLQHTLANVDQTGRIVEERAGRGRFRRLVSAVRGASFEEESKIFRDLVGHQQQLARHVDRMLRHSMAVDADIAQVAGHLRRTQYIAVNAEQLAGENAERQHQLARALAGLADFVVEAESRLDSRIDTLQLALADLESRVTRLETERAADRALAKAVARWRSGAAYAGLPWTVQVLLLAQEVFTGPCGRYELLTGDTETYREELREALVGAGGPAGAEGTVAWTGRQPVPQVLADAAGGLGGGELRLVVAELLGAELIPELDGVRGPLVGRLRALLAPESPPGATADGFLPRQLTGAGFARHAVDEQADTVLRARRAVAPLDSGPGRGGDGTGTSPGTGTGTATWTGTGTGTGSW